MKNYASLIDENEIYPVSYTIDKNGNKINENNYLKGGRLIISVGFFVIIFAK